MKEICLESHSNILIQLIPLFCVPQTVWLPELEFKMYQKFSTHLKPFGLKSVPHSIDLYLKLKHIFKVRKRL